MRAVTEVPDRHVHKSLPGGSFGSFLVSIVRAHGGTSIDAKNEPNGVLGKVLCPFDSGVNLTAKPSFFNCALP